jgi:short-subunit dehydrogenase
MRGKTVVIAGSTSCIGEVAAEILAKMGARIVLVARDKTRGLSSPTVTISQQKFSRERGFLPLQRPCMCGRKYG